MKTSTSTSRRLLAAAPALACLALVACGSDDESADTTAAAVTAAPTSAAPATTAAPDTTQATDTTTGDTTAGGETIDVVASDYAFGGIPETVAPGTRFNLTNASDKEFHEIVVFKVPEGEDRTLEEIIALPEAEQEAIFGQGPPAMVQVAPPNAEEGMTVLGDGTVSEPGRYIAACFIPEGADPAKVQEAMEHAGDEAPELEGGPPHVVLGMYTEFMVEG